MRQLLIVCLLSAGCAAGSPITTAPVPAVITDRAARESVGLVVTVTGQVAQVKSHTHHGLSYLNLGGRFPDHTFAVLIPDSALGRFGDLMRFEGRLVRATGLVWLQDDRYPAMTLTDPADLELTR